MLPFLANVSTYLGDMKINITSGVFPSIRLSMRYNHLRGITSSGLFC